MTRIDGPCERIARVLLVVLALAWVVRTVPAQIYSVDVRPSGLSYRVARTDHFDLIYQSGYDREAAATGAVLESALPLATQVTGTRRRLRIPVVLDAFSDRSNGFVAAFPFRSEITVPSLRGTSLSPRHESWLSVVGTHELVHMVQAEVGHGVGVTAVLRLFSPDLARFLMLSVPPGVSEGAAVFVESEGDSKRGRLNYSLFQMEYRAAVSADRPWSLAQMLERPRYSRPADRFYHGGAFLYRHLWEKDRGESIRRALQFNYRLPLLGFGTGLWYGTGRPPWVVGRDFRLAERQEELVRQVRLGHVTEPRVISAAKGLLNRRPRWISRDEVVVYSSGYYNSPGFYRVDVRSGDRQLISPQRVTEDFHFTIDADTTALLFSRYVPDPLVTARRAAEVFELRFGESAVSRTRHATGMFTPARDREGTIWGSANTGQYSRLTAAGEERRHVIPLLSRSVIRGMEWSPVGDSLVVLVNRDGAQGLVLARPSGGGYLIDPILFSTTGSVLDFSWFPDGSGLLFTSDAEGVSNVYSFDFATGATRRLTNARFGMFEPGMSPDGREIALIDYQHEQWNLVTIEYEPSVSAVVADGVFSAIHLYAPDASPDPNPSEIGALSSRPYRAVRYLAPRALFPLFTYQPIDKNPGDVELGFGVGAAVAGADPLKRWSYVVGAFRQAGKFWGRATVQSGLSVLRPAFTAFRTPSTRIVRTEDGIRRVGREEEGVTGRFTLPVLVESNIRSSSIAFSLQGQYSRARLFGVSGEPLTNFESSASIVPTAVVRLSARRYHRDLRERGLVVGATALVDAWSATEARKAFLADVRLNVRSIPGTGGSIGLIGSYLWQSRPAVYDLDLFLPRGLDDTFVAAGGHVKYGVDLLQPLLYVDDGILIPPVFVHAVYLFGFLESISPTSELSWEVDSVGGGIGVQLRLMHLFNLDFRFGGAYLPARSETVAVFR